MDTKKLAALAAAVRLGSFTRAAEELGYTQSGLTHMMNSLEKDVGFPVLVRSRSGVRLTPAGQRIFPLVQECLAGAEALEHEILLINTHQEESVRVRLSGPGVDGALETEVPRDVLAAIRTRNAQAYEYPQGVDFFFLLPGDAILAIPRLVRMEDV